MVSKRLSKFIKSLKIKKFRVREKCFLVEGKKNVLELINSDFVIRNLLVTQDFINENQLPLSDVGDLLIEVTPDDLKSLGTFQINQDCLAVAEIKNYSISDINPQEMIFALDGVGDPGNLGTIIRTLDWYGYTQLLCGPETAEVYNPKVINSTMGSFTRVKVIYDDIAKYLSESSLDAYGADLEGVNIYKWKPESPSIIVLGSESHGISPEVQAHLTDKVSIPKFGGAESLNVAIATSIFCHHLRS